MLDLNAFCGRFGFILFGGLIVWCVCVCVCVACRGRGSSDWEMYGDIYWVNGELETCLHT